MATQGDSLEKIRESVISICEKAKISSRKIAALSSEEKNSCIEAMAASLEKRSSEILEANAKDVSAARKNAIAPAMLDRLKLDEKRILTMSESLRNVATLEDPCSKILSSVIRPNGLKIEKISVPIGVICVIYESRPNVTADSAGLCIKAGNSVILRGGSESIHSNSAIAHALNSAMVEAGLPDGVVQLIPYTDRRAVEILLKMDQYIDLVIPRGGESLIRAVSEQSRIPVIKHYKGICHIYVDEACDEDMAEKIIVNAKCQRPGVCNAAETLLIHSAIAPKFARRIGSALKSNGVEIRGCPQFISFFPDAKPASEKDWSEEYLDLIISVRVVPDIDSAIEHINYYGSKHSDAIITSKSENAEKFLMEVDSATVYVNASTRFTDGGEFGMGAEIGISTDKLHARGPMGLAELNTYKYVIHGNGQCRK